METIGINSWELVGQHEASASNGFEAHSAKQDDTLVRSVHGGNFWKKIEHRKIHWGLCAARLLCPHYTSRMAS